MSVALFHHPGAKYDEPTYELELRGAQQAAIANLGQAALAGASMEVLFDVTVSYVTELLGADLCSVLEKRGESFHTTAGSPWVTAQHVLDARAASLAAYVIETTIPTAVEHLPSETRFPPSPLLLRKGVISCVAVPIMAGHAEAWGALAAYWKTSREISTSEVDFLRALASVLGQAVQLERRAKRQSDAMRDLAASEERYREVVEGASEVIFTLSMDGRLQAINAAFEKVTGYPAAEWIGKPYIELLHPDERAHSREVFRAVIERQEAVQDTLTLVGRDKTVYIELTSFPKVVGGRTTAIYGFARDITEERRIESERLQLEAKLAQADRLTSLGRLAATVAHEFNNILMGIGSFGEMIRRGKNVPAAVEQIGQSVRRGKRITSDILRFTQHAEPVRAPFDVTSWLDGIAVEARSLMHADCEVQVAIESPLRIDGDASQLQQVFTNLVLNARDAMPNGGTFSITAKTGAPPHYGGRFAYFVVRDSGCGMTPETLRHIFEPLFTTKKNGTGLGLAVAHQVVTRHGGEMFVESALGKGTTFHIFLPLTTEELPAADAPVPVPIRGPQSRMLLVEDDQTVGEGLRALLSLENVDVTVATSGADAIRAVHHGVYDVVVLDVGLPDIDGMRVYEAIAALRPKLPIIFSTGHASQAVAGITRPDVAFLLKPYDTAVLLETMREVMNPTRAAC